MSDYPCRSCGESVLGVSVWIVGRQYCPACRRSFGVVRPDDVTELRCPKCDGPTMESHGHDGHERLRAEREQ